MGEHFATRLFVRRGLLLTAFLILTALAVTYSVPLHAAGLAALTFTIAAAAIPRGGLLPLSLPTPSGPRPEVVAHKTIEALPGASVLLAQDGTVLSCNGRAVELFSGLKRGAHISAAIRNPQVLDAVSNCVPGREMKTVTFAERVPVERHFEATVSYLALEGAGEEGPAIILTLRDLTEQRRVDQLRSDFIANASHEIKTPLASLLGFIETLQGPARDDPDARARFLAIMERQGQRMNRLIDNLMSLSRVEMRAHLRPQDQVMITELVHQAREALEPMACEANITVIIGCEIGEAIVLGDKDELTQVFLNLIHNAIKYGRPGGTVNIAVARTESTPPQISITVADNGPGIERQHLPRLTERFYRVPESASLERGGTGLGLAIVKHVVNRHRGEFRIASEEGVGSRFSILLAEHVPAPAAPLTANDDGGWKKTA